MKGRIIIIFILLLFTRMVSGQENDTIQRVKAWKLSSDFTGTDTLAVDTAFSMFHRFRIADKETIFNAYTGNYGLPFYPIGFFNRNSDPDNFLIQGFLPYLFRGSEANFINTTTPFTELKFSYAGPRNTSEQSFRVTHTQNINKDFNVGLLYDIIYSIGQYPYQRTSDKRFNLWGSYSGNSYEAYFSLAINNLFFKENGGISSTDQIGDLDPADMQVNLGGLSAAGNNLRNRDLLLVQKLTLGKGKPAADSAMIKVASGGLQGTLLHAFELSTTKRNYSDKNPGGGFYDSVYINNSLTSDSLSERTIMNTLRFDVTAGEGKNFRIGFGGGIRNEVRLMGQIVPHRDSVYADTLERVRVSNVLIGKLYNNIGDGFGWSATGELWATGYRSGDIRVTGEMNKRLGRGKNPLSVYVDGGFEAISPSYWFSAWGSNHFQWSLNAEKEFRITAGGTISDKRKDFIAGARYAIIDNFSYFDSLAMPTQHTGGLSVLSLSLKKNFTLWKLHLDSDVMVQQSSNSEVLSLPLVAAASAFYFQHNFLFPSTEGSLNTQFGVEATYHTLYKGMGYMPATLLFYNQQKQDVGNYPFINLFLNIKLKRTRFLLMLDHVNAGFTGTDYMMVPGYPMNVRMFRYGLSWTFYD